MNPPVQQKVDPTDVIREQCLVPFVDAWAEIEERVRPSALTAIAAAVAAHTEVSGRAGLSEPPPTDPDVRSEALVNYRREMAGEVLSPLLIALKEGPSAAVAKALRSAEARAISGARGLPASEEWPWDAGSWDPVEGDSFGRRFRKALARPFAGGSAGKTRSVPVRALASDFVEKELMPGQVEAARDAVRLTTGWMSALETAWGVWSDQALPVLMNAERAEEVTEEEAEAEWTTVAQADKVLAAALSDVADQVETVQMGTRVSDRIETATRRLEGLVRAAGGFAYLPKLSGKIPTSEEMEKVLLAARDWDAQALARLELNEALLDVLSGGKSARGRLGGRLRIRLVEPGRELASVADKFDAFAQRARDAKGEKKLADILTSLETEATAEINGVLDVVPSEAEVAEFVESAANGTIESLQGMIRQVPASLELHPQGAVHQVGRTAETRTVALQEMARQAFDALRVERIRSAMLSVTGELQKVCADARELPSVVAYGFEAARKDLAPVEESAKPAEADLESGQQAADLMAEALERTAGAIRAYPANLEAVLDESRTLVADEVAQACESLFGRAGARRTKAQLLAAQSRFSEFRVRMAEDMAPTVERVTRTARLQWLRVSRVVGEGYRRASRLFGRESVADARSTRTIRTLAAAETGDVPLVYQKLFSTEPISDPTLLAGRDGTMADAMNRWIRWKSGQGTPTIFIGRPGSGVTSFVNVLVERINGAGGKAVSVSLQQRVLVEADLVGLLAAGLGMPAVATFDELVSGVLSAEGPELPDALGLDTLEHVYLRSSAGTDLFERLLTFMSETDGKIFWFGGITMSSWQVLQKAEPTAVSQVDTVSLNPLSAADLKAAVILRHRRSGLQVVYQDPTDSGGSLGQRIRKWRGRGGRQEVLETEFFDQLHRASLGTLRLALFQWLVAADFHTGDGQVRMGALTRPDFSTLDTLDLTQSFSLKAFLEHRTLSLAEHDEVFRLPRQESYQVFESLANRQLIEALGVRTAGRPEVDATMRYRIKPLLEGAVISHLERRNIVH